MQLVMTRLISSSSIVIASLDTSFTLLSTGEIGSAPDGSSSPIAAAHYGNGLAIVGGQYLELPAASGINLAVTTNANTWQAVVPGEDQPLLIVQDTPTDLAPLANFALDRQTADGDNLVCLTD